MNWVWAVPELLKVGLEFMPLGALQHPDSSRDQSDQSQRVAWQAGNRSQAKADAGTGQQPQERQAIASEGGTPKRDFIHGEPNVVTYAKVRVFG